MDTDELLARLASKGVRNVEIARALDLPDSRVPEIKAKKRALKLDEAVKLVRAFGLEPGLPSTPLATPILRLVVRYVAEELGVRPAPVRIQELTEDVRAFAELAADPKFGNNLEAAEAFFRALRTRRPSLVKEAPQGSDPGHNH